MLSGVPKTGFVFKSYSRHELNYLKGSFNSKARLAVVHKLLVMLDSEEDAAARHLPYVSLGMICR
jgi:hypothetical protein